MPKRGKQEKQAKGVGAEIKVSADGSVECPECGEYYAGLDDLKRHIYTDHFDDGFKEGLGDYLYRFEKAYYNFLGRDKTVIVSKRGTRIYSYFRCNRCGIYGTSGWNYKETSKGELNLCHACKAKLKPARPPYRTIVKTPVETSRNKH